MPEETSEISELKPQSEPIENINNATKVAPNVLSESTSEFLFNSFINEVDANNNNEGIENKNMCQQQQSNEIDYNQYEPVSMYETTNHEYLESDLVKPDYMIALDPKLRIFNSSVLPPGLKLSDLVSTDPDYQKHEDELIDEYTHLSKKHQQLKKYKRQSSLQDSNNSNNKLQELSTLAPLANTKLLDIETSQITSPANQASQNPNIFLLNMTEQQRSDGTDDAKNIVGISDENRVHTNTQVVESPKMSEKIPKLFTVNSHKKPKTLPPHATMIMNEWYEAHKEKPYPTEAERAEMAEKGDLNENQVKAWFANKRNRSSRTPGIVKKKSNNNNNNKSSSRSTNAPQTYTTCPTTASMNKTPLIPGSITNQPTKPLDVDIIKPEKNEGSNQILTLLNGPIIPQSTPNATDINKTQVKKAPKRKISKAASASLASNQANNKVKKPIKIQPMIQPRPPPPPPVQSIMPLKVDSPGQFKINKSNVHLVPIQPNTPVVTPPMQYYHSLPEPIHKPMSFVHAPPNFPGYSMDPNNSGPNNVSQSPANQILDENAYQQTMTQHYHQQQQQMFQPIQSRPTQAQQKMQQKHQLQIQLQQLVHQKQQQQHHHQQYMQQQTQQQNTKSTWEHQQHQQQQQQQTHFFNPCYYPTKPPTNPDQTQYQPNFPRNFQEINSYFNINEGPSLMPQLDQMSPFQNIPTPNSIHSASSLTSTFNFNEPYAQQPAVIYQKDNQQALMHHQQYQQQQQQQQNYQKHLSFQQHPKQCFDPNCYAVASTQPSNQPLPTSFYHHQSVAGQNQTNYQPELAAAASGYKNTVNTIPNEMFLSQQTAGASGLPVQMQLLNHTNSNMNQILTSVPLSASVSGLSSNQQQYQCDTPPPIITKKSTPTNSNQSSSSATPIGSGEDNNRTENNNKSTDCVLLNKSTSSTNTPTPNSSNGNASNLTWFTENNTIVDANNRNLYNMRANKLACNGSSNMSSPSRLNNGIQSPKNMNSNLSVFTKSTDETPTENINFALQNLDHISNLNIVNIHPKALENTSVNISINGNQQAYYSRQGELEHSDENVLASSAFHQYVSHVHKQQQQDQQQESRFTDSKNKDWCISHHPRLSNTLLNVQIPIQTAAAPNSMPKNVKRI